MPRTGERGGPETRARILGVSNPLFMQRGFDSVTVAEVAREAGVSSVTVFKHFPTKEDLFFDRSDDAMTLLSSAIGGRSPGVDVLDALRDLVFRLADERHALSGLKELSLGFFRTVAGSPSLINRARQLVAELQAGLAAELDRASDFEGDAGLLAALFIAGYTDVLVDTTRRLLASEDRAEVENAHRARLQSLFTMLRGGVGPSR